MKYIDEYCFNFDPYRFKPSTLAPLPPSLNATHYGSRCLQLPLDDSMSEDCLFLNIFVPVDDNFQQKLPVFVYIHGGGYVIGASDVFEVGLIRY